MSDTGRQSPLGVNVLGSILDNKGININPIVSEYVGISKNNTTYTPGKIVTDTCLHLLTLSINDAYLRNLVPKTLTSDVYDKLISIGSTSIPALGNAKPPTYIVEDPSGIWTTVAVKYGMQKSINDPLPGPATSGYAITSSSGQGQQATWIPYTGVSSENPNRSITQWGYLRLHALQAWNEFNWNGEVVNWEMPEYKEFLSSFLTAEAFVANSNESIFSMRNSKTFLEYTYSNMNDLISADVTGVSLSTYLFGTDLINLGKAIDLSNIESFGLPSRLLKILYTEGVFLDDVVLALIAMGLSTTEIEQATTTDQLFLNSVEKNIYNALLLISGDTLRDILAVLKCKISGIETLADLLDVKKLFPNSYQTLTVPVYNDGPNSNNSKTYYLIYQNDSVNSQLSSETISNIIGTQIVPGISPISNQIADGTNYYELPKGFGSYLYNIIPFDIATAAGAFSYSMRQIRNIKYCDIQTFAQVVRSIETTIDLPQTAGTNKPVNEPLADTGLGYTALGSGIYGTYTMSDLFGCMSGLPYPWKNIYSSISNLQTEKLSNIYSENFLATTWDGASVEVVPEERIVEISPGEFQTEYRVESFNVLTVGGGYGRGSAPDPIITASNGGTGAGIVEKDPSLAGSNGGGTFGRIISTVVTDPGPWQLTPPTATIQYPPTDTLPVQINGRVASNGTNSSNGTVGWPSMNTVVSAYISQANAEILEIQNNNKELADTLNDYWNLCGTQLKIEQRTRYIAMSPVAVVPPDSSSIIRKDYFVNQYPTSQYSFVDAIPELAQNTQPHMSAQTIEAISDLSTPGGQSIVALMRESRNKNRLYESGITLDNTILNKLSDEQETELLVSGTIDNTNTAFLVQKSPVNNQDVTPIPQITIDELEALIETGGIPDISEPYIISVPIYLDPVVPENLDTTYTSSTLLSSTLSVEEAIDQVIKCNCECWLN